MKKVMCFGTFDLLHLGHLNYFKQAKQLGDYLIVVIARDKTKQDQQKKTVFTEDERLELIGSLNIVDEVVLGYKDNHFRIIKEKNPAIICLGYDHPITELEIQEKLFTLKLNPIVVRAKSFHPENQKSSRIKELILDNSN
jgi:FAD synthetase